MLELKKYLSIYLMIFNLLIRDDIIRAIKSLKSLGSGFQIIQIGNRKLVQSVPMELNIDHTQVLELGNV